MLDSHLSTLAVNWKEGLIVSSWPVSRQEEGWENQCITDFSLIQETVRTIRNLRSEKNVKPGKRIPAILSAGEKTELFHRQKNIVSALAQLDLKKFDIVTDLPPKGENQVAIAIGSVEIYLPLEELVDTGEERDRAG